MYQGKIGLKVKIPQSGSVLEHIVYIADNKSEEVVQYLKISLFAIKYMYKLMLKENVQLICVFNKILTEYIMTTHKRCNSYLITTNREEGVDGNLLQRLTLQLFLKSLWCGQYVYKFDFLKFSRFVLYFDYHQHTYFLCLLNSKKITTNMNNEK